MRKVILDVDTGTDDAIAVMVAYKERFDKDNFIKNLLLDNLLLVDIYSRSKKAVKEHTRVP